MAIRMASDRILATVEAIGKLKQGQYGEFQSVLLQRSDLLGFCFETVHQRLAVLDGTAQTAAAIELYRSTVRKFEL